MAKQVMQPDALPVLTGGMNKQQITELARQSVENVLEHGRVEQVAEALAVMDEFVKQVRRDDRFIDLVRDELVKYNGTMRTVSGARIELCEAGVTYDYADEPAWRELDAGIRALTEQKKKLEEKLRGIGAGKMVVDHETGEVITGALRSSKSTYRITLSK